MLTLESDVEVQPARFPISAIPHADVDENGVFRVQQGEREVYERAFCDHFSSFDDQAIRWLWPERIPLGRLTLIDGAGKSGKSFLAADLAARVTRGSPWPGLVHGPELAGEVVYAYAEDRRDDTVCPRLKRAGADFERLIVLAGVTTFDPAVIQRGKAQTVRPLSFPADLGQLEYTIRRHRETRLVVIDPLPAFSRDEESYARTLVELDALAERCGVAVVATSRLNSRQSASQQLGGDRRNNAVRCVFSVVVDPSEAARRFLAPVRMNFCREPPWLAFDVTDEGVVWDASGCALSATLAGRDEKAAILKEVVHWLQETLREEDLPASAVRRWARQNGHSSSTLDRARRRLGVRAYRQGFGAAGWWFWSLRPEPAPEVERSLARRRKRRKRTRANQNKAHRNGNGVVKRRTALLSNGGANGDEIDQNAIQAVVQEVLQEAALEMSNGRSRARR